MLRSGDGDCHGGPGEGGVGPLGLAYQRHGRDTSDGDSGSESFVATSGVEPRLNDVHLVKCKYTRDLRNSLPILALIDNNSRVARIVVGRTIE